jgi:hypothetical protein
MRGCGRFPFSIYGDEGVGIVPVPGIYGVL